MIRPMQAGGFAPRHLPGKRRQADGGQHQTVPLDRRAVRQPRRAVPRRRPTSSWRRTCSGIPSRAARISTPRTCWSVFGRPKGDRGSYRQWEEGGVPLTVVFEVLSPGNTPEMATSASSTRSTASRSTTSTTPTATPRGLRPPRRSVCARVRQGDGFVSPRLGIRFDLSGPEMVVYRPDGRRFLTFESWPPPATSRARADQAEQRADRPSNARNRPSSGRHWASAVAVARPGSNRPVPRNSRSWSGWKDNGAPARLDPRGRCSSAQMSRGDGRLPGKFPCAAWLFRGMLHLLMSSHRQRLGQHHS